MDRTPAVPDPIRDAAATLAGASVQSVRLVKSGANNRIFRVDTPKGLFALKSYPARPGDTRNRADTEWRALRFLTERGLGGVPIPYARDAGGRFLLMEWLEGAPLEIHEPADVTRAAEFVARIFELSGDPEARGFPLASEACLSAATIIRQIEQRLDQFAVEETLDTFLACSFRPIFEAARRNGELSPEADAELAPGLRRLIPADFGFHNVIRQADGRLRYFDFEYFGWDDPVKLTADFLLHPAMRLSADDRSNFIGRMVAVLQDDEEFFLRLRCRLPLFALRWVLILFNPFRSDRMDALPCEPDRRRSLLDERIAKARALLEWTDADRLTDRLRVAG